MKIEITTTQTVKEIIEVDFPYYYEHDLWSEYGDTVIYGKIMPEYEITIKEDKTCWGSESFEITKQKRNDCYFDKKYKSSQATFEDAKKRTIDCLAEWLSEEIQLGRKEHGQSV